MIVEKYPANLITQDRWGALPLLYAFWGAAPTEIIQFLLESYQTLHPGYVFNWTLMVETMGRCDTPKESIENLLRVKQLHFPEQPIDWEYLLDKFVKPSYIFFSGAPFQERMRFHFICGLSTRVEALAFKVWRDHIENMIQTSLLDEMIRLFYFSFPSQIRERMQFLVMCGLSTRVEALAFEVWRDYITNMIHTSNFGYNRDNSFILNRIREKLAHFDDKLSKLTEATTILELALWKTRLDENGHKRETSCRLKKVKPDVSDIRQQCRVTCGADIIIRLVLPFLITAL